MSSHGYKRTNFEEEEDSNNPSQMEMSAGVVFKGGASVWKSKSRLEQILLVLTVVLSVTVVILAVVLSTKQNPQKAANTTTTSVITPSNVCLEPTCVNVASNLMLSMDTSVDPCEDFYHYACGNWIRNNPIPSGHSEWDMFSMLWDRNLLAMKNAIEKKLPDDANSAERKAQIYYQSCMDENKTIEALGAKPLRDLLSDIGNWTIQGNDVSFDFQQLLEKIHLHEVSVFFSVWVDVDDRDISHNILMVDQGGLGLPNRNYYINRTIDEDKVLSAYLEYMTEIGILLGGEENHTRSQMRDVILFEMELANITIPAEQRRDEEKNYHKMTIQQLSDINSVVDWIHFLNTLLNIVGLNIKSSEKMVVYAPEYLGDMSALVSEKLRTDEGKRVIYNYMMWHVIKSLTGYLSKPFRSARKVLTEALSGAVGGEEIWKLCITDTDSVIGFALGAMFVKEAFHGNSKDKAEKMIVEVKNAFKANLPNLDWIDPQTRKAAIEKANAVIDMIGFPEYILNKTRLDKEYDRLKFSDDEYFQNNVRNLNFSLVKNLEQLPLKPKRNKWDMTPPTINAYYSPTKNEMVFPAGILQAPFYDKHFPKSLNFGAMGVVMGHELTHGFDDEGREFDKNGNLRPWWNNKTIDMFKQRAQCMVKQYSQFDVNGEKVNGNTTLGENIADNGGLKSAFHAYEHWLKSNEEERPLPGINMTHKQLFFLGFSQLWCTNIKKESEHMQLVSDAHSPAKYRVIGTLSNSVEFSKHFKCPVGSKMNPKKKCEVW